MESIQQVMSEGSEPIFAPFYANESIGTLQTDMTI